VGVDGGATKTDAVVMAADGRVIGSGRAGSSNWESIGVAQAVDAIALAVDGALAEAGHARREVTASVFALAGVDWPGDQIRLAGALDFLGLGGGRFVTNDAFAALRAGISGQAGCVSSAGTGAVAGGPKDARHNGPTM
jgi:N-acetylglucosamine kinase-like BadF-type ATPase